MKLIIQIPCYNEADTLPLVVPQLPRQIPGIDTIEFQIIDDGSTDRTVEVARELGVHHIVQVKGRNRRWLGRAFRLGIDNALAQGADIVVNTDGDNQYPADRIADLVRPIVDGAVDIVIGDRNPTNVEEFSPTKKKLQGLGNQVIATLTREEVRDAVSGFRAFSRSALLKINVFTHYTYTVDSLMQAYEKGIDIAWIPITPNEKTRDSRLIKSLTSKVRKSGTTILRMATVYRPFRTFSMVGAAFLLPGLALLARFAYYYFFVPGHASGHLHSVVAGGVLLILGFQLVVLGVVGDLLSVNRILVEDALSRLRKMEVEPGNIIDSTSGTSSPALSIANS